MSGDKDSKFGGTALLGFNLAQPADGANCKWGGALAGATTTWLTMFGLVHSRPPRPFRSIPSTKTGKAASSWLAL